MLRSLKIMCVCVAGPEIESLRLFQLVPDEPAESETEKYVSFNIFPQPKRNTII